MLAKVGGDTEWVLGQDGCKYQLITKCRIRFIIDTCVSVVFC